MSTAVLLGTNSKPTNHQTVVANFRFMREGLSAKSVGDELLPRNLSDNRLDEAA